MKVWVDEDVGGENLGKVVAVESFIASWLRGAGQFSLPALVVTQHDM